MSFTYSPVDFPPPIMSAQGEKRSNPSSPSGDSPDSKVPRADSAFVIPDQPSIDSPSVQKFKESVNNLKGFTVDKKTLPLFLSYVTQAFSIAAAVMENQDSRLKSQENEIADLKNNLSVQRSELSQAKSSFKENDSKISFVSNTITTIKSQELAKKTIEELEFSNRSVKINNFPSNLLSNCENPKSVIRQHLENSGPSSKNALHDTSITILSNLKNNKNPTVPVLISCKNSLSKSELSKAIQKESPSFNLSFHFPTSLHKRIKMIRDKLTNVSFSLDDKSFCLKKSWIMIRPTSDSSRLKILFKNDKNQPSWTFLTTLPLPTDKTDDVNNFNWGKIVWNANKGI